MLGILVVQGSSSTKLIMLPLSIVSQSLWLIKQLPMTLNMSINPLSLVHPSILIVKSTYSVFDSIHFISLISTALSISLSHILSLKSTLFNWNRTSRLVIIRIAYWFLSYCTFICIKNHVLVDLSVRLVCVGRKYVSERSCCCDITGFEKRKRRLLWYCWHWIRNRRWTIHRRMIHRRSLLIERIPRYRNLLPLKELQLSFRFIRRFSISIILNPPENLLQKIRTLPSYRLVILLNLNHMLFQFCPIRPRSLILGQHKFKKISQFRRIRLLKPIQIIVESLPMYPGKLLSITLILIRQKPSLKQNHPQSPNVSLERITNRKTSLLLQTINLLRRYIQMRLSSIRQ